LHGIDFSISVGETVGLMGRNGMGKTTLIRSLVGHLPPRRGEVKINGRIMTRAAAHLIARQDIAYVPEGRGIFPNLTVKENLTMAARASLNGQRDWDYQRVLKTFPRLAERLSHGGQQLSGGEQQMLAIGRGLMANPRLLLVDEISLGLAPVVVKHLYEVLGGVHREGTTLLVVEQDVSQVLAVAQRVYCFRKGAVALEGVPARLTRAQISAAYFGA
jgi:branched-chain amino acid transport system ATP-binding protein